jgi:hypothetical protein
MIILAPDRCPEVENSQRYDNFPTIKLANIYGFPPIFWQIEAECPCRIDSNSKRNE